MISRVAETCFWLFRYLERADATARLLRVHAGVTLDAALPPSRTWRPLLIVQGELPRFVEQFGDDRTADAEAVQDYFTWNETNPVSIVSSVRAARESARTIRETVSLEMWQALNALWIWLQDDDARRQYVNERTSFYEEVTHRLHRFHGACQNTMLHEEPFDFMRLGLNLERVNQTARVLDLQHYALQKRTSGPEGAVEAAEWIAILRACAAYEPFFKKRMGSLSGPEVAEFLLFETAFPGSVNHSLTRAWNFHRRIQRAQESQVQGNGRSRGKRAGGAPTGTNSEVGAGSARLLRSLKDDMGAMRIEDVLKGIHEVLTEIVDRTSDISNAIRDDYFAPERASLPPDAALLSEAAPSGSNHPGTAEA